MIVKHVPMNTVRKSNFGDLARYVSDPQERNERVGDIRITNCHADELADAALEVMATQARNTRAEGDKTYHLIISFRADEEPAVETLVEIEQRTCAGLGFGEHQRQYCPPRYRQSAHPRRDQQGSPDTTHDA